MFYPDIFISRNSLLYRMYVHACMKSHSTAVPLSSLADCLDSVFNNSLSLRLHSKLMLSIAHSLLLHYKSTLSSTTKALSINVLPSQRTGSSRVSDNITYSYNLDILCDAISKRVAEVNDEVECARGASSSMSLCDAMNNSALAGASGLCLNNSMNASNIDVVSVNSRENANEVESAKRVRVDRTIDLARESIMKSAMCVEKWYKRIVDSLLANEYTEIVGDISSIEAVRRYSSDRAMDEIAVIDRISDGLGTHEYNYEVNYKLVDFISLLQEITDGKVSAIQTVPYGRIIRI
ncbi:hypothetical protein NEMIN01_0411 [Nematocida minor]|uniref:uncharacterized protein n=1 Tax=Nematocida minor TaxID=1912983 RepID=UPI00222042D2|nr:uncharacterized protein NEMIN01_0411 [Nematocida minor]KAI5189245.1 hypothetical protein NEMIN01_0411 [Nematocida minor]